MKIKSTPENFRSRKFPRYLYHLTTTEGLKKIQESKAIKPSDFTLGLNYPAVFLFELKNYTKNWGVKKDWNYNNLAKDLLSQCAHDTLTLALIRVPVDKLDKNRLRIRCLNELFSSNKKTYHIMEGSPAKYSKLYKGRKKALEYIYPEEIKTKDIEVLGSVENFRQTLRKLKLKGLLLKLFKGQPEEKLINELK